MSNSIKTVLLLGLLSGLLLFIGGMIGGRAGLTYALGFAAVMNILSWWFSDKIVLWMYGAKELSGSEAPKIHRMVEELSRDAGMPKPRVYHVSMAAPNAFATGRGPGHAAVAVTSGIVDLLSERELRGVLSHELAHIKNRDTLISAIAATIAAAITYLAYMMRFAAIFGGGRGGDDDRGGGNALALLLVSILAPIAALFIQMAISRSREYVADAGGAAISHDPHSLADALEKLRYGASRFRFDGNPATSHLFIVNPFSGRRGGQWFLNMFSTHPPVEERVRRLRAM